jgi:DNA-directed RNA polymerase I subunit RPA49
MIADDAHVKHIGRQDVPEYCHYAIGTLDHKTMTLSSAPIYKFHTQVKESGYTERMVGMKNMAARDSLGQMFGTKKRKLDIKAKVENKVEMSSIAPVADAIKSTIESQTESLPTRGYQFLLIW